MSIKTEGLPPTSIPPPGSDRYRSGRTSKENSCVMRAWEAIKNFFKSVCCCCWSHNYTDLEVDDGKNPSVHRVSQSVTQIFPSPPLTLTQEGEGPLSPQQPTLPSGQPLAEENQDESISENEKVPPISASKMDEIEEPRLSTYDYIPLNNLALRRQTENYAPIFPQPNPVSIDPCSDFPYLEAYKSFMANRVLPPLNAAYILSVLPGLINGSCTLPSYDASPKGIAHPSQFEMIINYIEHLISQFETSRSRPEKPYKIAEEVTKVWETEKNLLRSAQEAWSIFLETAQKSLLGSEDLKKLADQHTNLLQLNADFFSRYPQVKEKMKQALTAISTLPLQEAIDENLMISVKSIFLNLSNTWQTILIPPRTTQEIICQHIGHFHKKLFQGLANFFQEENGKEEEKDDLLQPSHVFDMLSYANAERLRLNDACNLFVKELDEQNFQFRPVEENEFMDAFKELKSLASCWEQIKKLAGTELRASHRIDEQIQLLKSLADDLPEAENACWNQFPKLKGAITKILDELNSKESLSEYQFRPTYNAADQDRMDCITKAYLLIQKKLGKEMQIPEVWMDTTKDCYQSYQLIAQDLIRVYNNNLNLGKDFALTQVQESLKLRFDSNKDPKSTVEFILGVQNAVDKTYQSLFETVFQALINLVLN